MPVLPSAHRRCSLGSTKRKRERAARLGLAVDVALERSGCQVLRPGGEFERLCSQAQSAGKLQEPPSQCRSQPVNPRRCQLVNAMPPAKRQKTQDMWTEGIWAEKHHQYKLPLTLQAIEELRRAWPQRPLTVSVLPSSTVAARRP